MNGRVTALTSREIVTATPEAAASRAGPHIDQCGPLWNP